MHRTDSRLCKNLGPFCHKIPMLLFEGSYFHTFMVQSAILFVWYREHIHLPSYLLRVYNLHAIHPIFLRWEYVSLLLCHIIMGMFYDEWYWLIFMDSFV